MNSEIEKMENICKTNKGFVIVNNQLKCEYCDVIFHKFGNKSGKQTVERHLLTQSHQENQTNPKSKKRKSFENSIEKEVVFKLRLALALMAANIPFAKVDNPVLKEFLEEFTGCSVPSATYLRGKYLNLVYEEKLQKLREIIGLNYVYLMIDETTDFMNRIICNIMVGILNGTNTNALLLSTQILQNTNSESISRALRTACELLWNKSDIYTKVLLVLSDQAPSMIKGIQISKQFLPNIQHVTCVAHALHRVCESIRENNKKSDRFIALMKKILKKSPHRKSLFTEITKLSLPINPVITRWGTWLEAVIFYSNNFELIAEFIKQLSLTKKSAAVIEIKELIKDNELKTEIFNLKYFEFLIKNIKTIQSQSLTLQQQSGIIYAVKSQLKGYALEKLIKSLKKNPDFEKFTSNLSFNTTFAPITTVAVETSFSKLNLIITDRRTGGLYSKK